ncbi:hypothetical protein BFW01_g1284 [Lasiodiplodia theobromae]|uniref:Uncharacterized protein n=1 Tax=Lasiodiplodia theobromae TaxID=45133 RepID=A0A8H7ITN2_9PEZI|nr:hypothetical protein BFW01_g1284 [Lasiodiplodia theobromae]
MASFFPHAQRAEDQRYAHSILTVQSLLRGFTIGPVIALTPFSIKTIQNTYRRNQPLSADQLRAGIIRSGARGVAIGTTINAFLLVCRMWGKDESAWKDRSWSLLANKRQRLEDLWCLGSAGLGAGAAMGAGWDWVLSWAQLGI